MRRYIIRPPHENCLSELETQLLVSDMQGPFSYVQIMIGGLRGLPEYDSVELIDFDKNGKVFRFLQEKVQKSKETKRHILNPLNKFTVELLKRNGGKLPSIKSAEVLNGYLKLIGYIAGLSFFFTTIMQVGMPVP